VPVAVVAALSCALTSGAIVRPKADTINETASLLPSVAFIFLSKDRLINKQPAITSRADDAVLVAAATRMPNAAASL